MKITLIDYKVGNLQSIMNALSFLDYDFLVDIDGSLIADSDVVILPGVASYGEGVANLQNTEQWAELKKYVSNKGSIVGICLGAQIFFESSEESPGVAGLGFFPGKIFRLKVLGKGVTNQGWIMTPNLENSSNESSYFFYSHSYFMTFNNLRNNGGIVTFKDHDILAWAKKDNIILIQFHPEKSGQDGLNFLRTAIQSFNVG